MSLLTHRFWSKVRISKTNFYKGTPCWEWTSTIHRDGYGKFWLNGKTKAAHRLSYEDKFGKIPQGLVINHMCRNRACQNRDDHLEVVTQKVNIQKGLSGFMSGIKQRLKTHCKQGHVFSKENTYVDPRGKRVCRTCNRISNSQYYQRKKLEGLT